MDKFLRALGELFILLVFAVFTVIFIAMSYYNLDIKDILKEDSTQQVLDYPVFETISQVTVTPGPEGGSQLATLEALIKPTPYHLWTEPEVNGFIMGMQGKMAVLPLNLRLLASYEGFGSGTCKTPLNLWEGVDIEVGNVAVTSFVWADWFAGISQQDMMYPKVQVYPGQEITNYSESETSPVIEHKKLARVVITIPKWGLIGPVVRGSNQTIHQIQDLNLIWRIILTPRELIWKENVPQEMRENSINSALTTARWDSLFHFSGGQPTYDVLKLLHAQLVHELNTSTVDSSGMVSPFDEIFNQAKEVAIANGYGGVESLTVRVESTGMYYLETIDGDNPIEINPEGVVDSFVRQQCFIRLNPDDLESIQTPQP